MDAASVDQLQVFAAVAEARSFTVAAERLGRAQSVVSYTVKRLEKSLDVSLFERTTRKVRLTEDGRVLLNEARGVLRSMDRLHATARTLGQGAEAALSIAIEAAFPIEVFATLARDFHLRFQHTQMRMATGVTAIPSMVVDGKVDVGLTTATRLPRSLACVPCGSLPMAIVASPDHPLAQVGSALPPRALEDFLHVEITDAQGLAEGRDRPTRSPHAWRSTDRSLPLHLVRTGLGWARLPRHRVQEDLYRGHLAELFIEGDQPDLELKAIYRRDDPPGPGGQWWLATLPTALAPANA
jgi:DNA-binding transcriptional LysR family regulator